MRSTDRNILSMNGKSTIFYTFLLLIGFIFGCEKKNTPIRPDGLLNSETMIAILKDVYITEARVAAMGLHYDSSQYVFDLVNDDILQEHGATDSLYLLSMDYYFEHPDELRFIFEAVVDSLSLQERKMTRSDNQISPEN